ncbi:expressed unknown protein [Seminavis robusta]|uniref:DUF6824 domain-containing protein n=1 Tax=Seminavis robusta TaxID=568900 RepID=A0A9N8E901_9STRA|nr:expressed unknown protein [Seminavis robusta]
MRKRPATTDALRPPEEAATGALAEEEASPTLDPVTQDVVSLTQQELHGLPPEEKQQVMVDLYGLGTVEEAPDLVDERLEELQVILRKIPDKRKVAYNRALALDSHYVSSREFLLMFLRADRFHPTPAANRLLICITQDDLDPESLDILYKTWYVDLPVHDRAGRHVSFVHSCKGADCHDSPVIHRMRVLFYTMIVAAQDIQTQIHGRVHVIWVTAAGLGQAADLWKIASMQSASVIRHQGIHMCIDQENGHVSAPMVSLAQMAMTAVLRVRVRRHMGNPSELKFALMTYGIPTESLPVSHNGEISHELHVERLKQIRNDERLAKQHQVAPKQLSESPSSTIGSPGDDENTAPSTKDDNEKEKPAALVVKVVDAPSNSDILMGKGKNIQNHGGNIRFRALIDQHRPRYDEANKTQKTQIAQEIVHIVKHGWKGRFLIRENKKVGWIPLVDDLAARQKVSSCFRDARKKELTQSPTTTHVNQIPAAVEDERGVRVVGAIETPHKASGVAAFGDDYGSTERQLQEAAELTAANINLCNEFDDLSCISDSSLLDSMIKEFDDPILQLISEVP